MSGFTVSPYTRAQYAPSADKLNISMDFNASPNGGARGTEVVIPDSAPPEVRAAAERYNQMVAEFARQNGIADYPVRGVRTRSENGRGVPHTMHVEPFFNDDMAMQQAIQNNPAAFAAIYQEAFGGLGNARLIAPHGVGNDRGAASSVFGDETSFGELMANALLGGSAPTRPQSGPTNALAASGQPLATRTPPNTLQQMAQQPQQQNALARMQAARAMVPEWRNSLDVRDFLT